MKHSRAWGPSSHLAAGSICWRRIRRSGPIATWRSVSSPHLSMGRLFGLAAPALRGAAQSDGVGTRRIAAERPLPAAEERRELLHDATEALLGGFDPITPIRPHLGEGYGRLVALHQAALDIPLRTPGLGRSILSGAQARGPLGRGERGPACRRLVPRRAAR